MKKKKHQEDIELETEYEVDESEMNVQDSVEENEVEDGYEDDEVYEDEYEDEETLRRRERHSRRVRNQIISYTVISILLIAIGVGLYFFISFIGSYIKGYVAEQKAAAAVEEEVVNTEESAVIEAPAAIEDPVVEDEEVIDESLFEEVDYLGEAVDATISQMTLEDKVAQLFFVTPELLTGVNTATQAGDGTKAALDKIAVGGLIYDSKNIESEEQVKALLETTASMSKYELFLAIAEPGGESSVIGNSTIAEIPHVDAPSEIGASGDSNNSYYSGLTISTYLANLGFNLDMAPDGSIIKDDSSIAISTSYGQDEAVVYDMTGKMVEGLCEGKIGACMTGFPGNGNITAKTSEGIVESDITAEELETQLLPYISGSAAGAKLIMVNNVSYTVADSSGVPASVSMYIVGKLLRENMGFTGVVITAPLSDKAITENMTSAEAAVSAILAGADMIYMPDNLEECYTGLLEAVNNGTVSEDRINESLERIFRVKLEDDIQ